ncbi:MAG: peptidase S10 [bacterium]|nr:peptidase S10 [bacterium]
MSDEDKKPQTDDQKRTESKPESPVQTRHAITINGRTLNYTVTTGMMPLHNVDNGEHEADIFFMAYTLDGVENPAERPLTFAFNGGPGSASIWLHLGALGPKRVQMQDEGWMPAPPYRLVTNEYTWLDLTDLVFIDPVGTGYSRAVKPDFNKKFWSLNGDIGSVSDFIRLYLTRYERWASPLFLSGESYGTTRAAGLSNHLFDRGIALNGIIMVSTVWNFLTSRFGSNDLPYALFLPTYASTAWYHGKLPKDQLERALPDFLAEVEAFASGDYLLALAKGDQLSADERAALIQRLAAYTGLEPRFVDYTNLRINIHQFCKELLRDQWRTVGRLDSRFKGIDASNVNEVSDFDPSLTAITPPYTATFNDYARRELRYESDVEYQTLSFRVNREWDWGQGGVDTSEPLRAALTKNPYMKVLLAQGYYDLATPHYAAQYTVDHMGRLGTLEASLRGNISTTYYEAGHMFYLDVKSLAKFKDDVTAFMQAALGTVKEAMSDEQ